MSDRPTLVYALTHARCEGLAERLRLDSYRVAPYHAEMPAAKRSEIQDTFFLGALDAVVATSAFGVGIDKPDVRTVEHAGMPGSPDEANQEIGRAGRAGQPAHAVLICDPRTVRIPRLLAARSKLGDASMHVVVDALEAAPGRITLCELAEASKVSRLGACDNDTSPAPAHRTVRTSLPAGVPIRRRLWGAGVLLSRDEHELVVAFDSVGYRHLTAAALTNGLLTMA
jgi:superfamily II DNA helicase RecQ